MRLGYCIKNITNNYFKKILLTTILHKNKTIKHYTNNTF